jgi:hypothetical protein
MAGAVVGYGLTGYLLWWFGSAVLVRSGLVHTSSTSGDSSMGYGILTWPIVLAGAFVVHWSRSSVAPRGWASSLAWRRVC